MIMAVARTEVRWKVGEASDRFNSTNDDVDIDDRHEALLTGSGASSARTNCPGKSLLHALVEGEQLRGQLPQEFLFGFDCRQSVDLPLLQICMGEDR